MRDTIWIGIILVLLGLLVACGEPVQAEIQVPVASIPDDTTLTCCNGNLCIVSQAAKEYMVFPVSCESLNGKGV